MDEVVGEKRTRDTADQLCSCTVCSTRREDEVGFGWGFCSLTFQEGGTGWDMLKAAASRVSGMSRSETWRRKKGGLT